MRWAPLAAVLAFLLPATAAACSCVPKALGVQWELTDPRAHIFIGTVEGNVPGSPPQRSTWFSQNRLVRIRPHLFLRGSTPGDTMEFWGGGFGDCDFEFEVGGSYFVVARPSEDGKLLAEGWCSSTQPLWAYGLGFGVLAVFLLLVSTVVWALSRAVRWLLTRTRPSSAPVSRSGLRVLRSPLTWLALFAVLMALAVGLVNVAPRLAPPLEVTVCNHLAAESLEQVEAQLMPVLRARPPTQLGGLKPGECRTEQLPVRGEESVEFTYRLQGVQHVVRDPALGYVMPGFHAYTEVQGPGRAESGFDSPGEPDRRILVLSWVLLASLVGAFAALLCAVGLGGWRLVRRLTSARAG
jgi:hypothetical protein